MPASLPLVFFENAMGRITAHAESYARVTYNAVAWDIEQLRALLTELGRLLLLRRWHRILVDLRVIQPLPSPVKAFLEEEWYGGKIGRPAQVVTLYAVAENVMARLSIHQMQQLARRGNLSEGFATLEEAESFLLTMPR